MSGASYYCYKIASYYMLKFSSNCPKWPARLLRLELLYFGGLSWVKFQFSVLFCCNIVLFLSWYIIHFPFLKHISSKKTDKINNQKKIFQQRDSHLFKSLRSALLDEVSQSLYILENIVRILHSLGMLCSQLMFWARLET